MRWLAAQDLDEIDTLYIVGLLGFPLPSAIERWLAARQERVLIFVEPRLGAFIHLQQSALLENPQIHFCYAEGDPIEQLARDFPSDRIAVFEGRAFDGLRLKRRSAAYSALYSDLLYSHKIVANVVDNTCRLSACFDGGVPFFTGLPLVICGAGPSLERAIPVLKDFAQKAVILAGGSAITVLSNHGIIPHLAMAFDPNDAEFNQLSQGQYFEGAFLFSPRLHRGVFATCNGPFGYLQTDTGGFIESFFNKALGLDHRSSYPDLGSEAFSVTTLALAWAKLQGFSPIFLAGVDLAYTEGRRYSAGVEESRSKERCFAALEQPLARRDLRGKRIETLLKWVMESDAIAEFCHAHPDLRVANGSEAGIGFEGLPNVSLRQELGQLPDRDIRGLVHQFTHQRRMDFDERRFASLVHELCDSLKRSSLLCDAIISRLDQGKEGGETVLFISDLQGETAYCALLEGIEAAARHLLKRYYPYSTPLERLALQYRELRRQIDGFLSPFEVRAKTMRSSPR